MAAEDQINVATGNGDKIGWAMTCVRAVEKINLQVMKRCAKAFPVIAELCGPDNPNLRTLPEYRKVKDLIISLARDEIRDELAELLNEGSKGDLQARTRKKENILTKLRRLIPGGV